MTGERDKLVQAGLNLIGQALSIFDRDLRLAVSNRQYQLMFDLPDTLTRTGTPFDETIRFLVRRGEYGPVEDIEEAVRARVEQARAFVPHYMERRRADGRWVAVEGSPLPQGGWVTVYTDITAIKRQEELLRARSEELSGQLLTHAEQLAATNRELAATNAALTEARHESAEAEARIRLVTEMTPAHIAHVNRDRVYTFSNRRLSAVMPGSLSDIVGRPMEVCLGAEAAARILPGIDRALAGEAHVFEITHAPSGRRIRIALTPDRDATGRVGGVYILSTDVTAEAQARAALTHGAKRELAAQLTSGLAHDFANLLTIILGLQGRLERMAALPEGAGELVAATLAAARRGGTLLDRIAAISGPRELRPHPVTLGPFLADLVTLAGPALGPRLTLTAEIAGLAAPVLLDAGSLQDALLNLILNARDAMAGGPGRITVRAAALRDTWIEITVEDEGPGFSPAALDHGLDPFFTTKGGEGSGLGLSMVFDHTRLAGGTVRLSNRAEGGARVVLRLPLRPAPAPGQPRLVLLVEDNETIRAEMRRLINDFGHAVIEAETADEALELARLDELGFVLSDIGLPGGLTGVALAESLATARPGLPVCLMTSLPPGDRLRAAARCPVLSKPVGAPALAAWLPPVLPLTAQEAGAA
ncbi:PAS-domain containing protein [Frigidibacter sp. MR17.14]|uniref:PAS-domain containing protein n=1 Tax=Frigidibacter sp. MR17.14 TaxID=3126509 RepID=UPI003012A35F